jgi:homoserine kinase
MSDGDVPFVVRAPASSANVGPGFDALGMALTLYADVGTGPAPAGARPADEHHPATVVARRLGAIVPLWVRTRIPMGRGLGFSGAVRVAGAIAATVARDGLDADLPGAGVDVAAHVRAVADEVLHVTAELEGHADNVAASLLGGVTAAAGDRAVRVPLGLDPHVVVWIPETTTSTEHSRRGLPATIERADAVFNIGRVAMLVAALAAGDVGALRDATRDRLHQDARFAQSPRSRAALDAGLDAGAWCGWLSGSGPTVAFLCARSDGDVLAAALPADGWATALDVDRAGARILRASTMAGDELSSR